MKFRNWFAICESFTPGTALLVIDMQNDFINSPVGVPDGGSIMPNVKTLISQARSKGIPVIFTAHVYKADHPKMAARPPEMRYCMANTFGADFHSDMDTKGSAVFNKDQYSAFDGGYNRDDEKESLAEHLKKNGIRRVIVVGLALDYCVGGSAIQARKLGFEAAVVMNATKGYADKESHEGTLQRLKQAGVEILPSL